MSEKKKKQMTLKKFGFSKKIEHNSKLVEVETPNFVSDVSGVIPCNECNCIWPYIYLLLIYFQKTRTKS